jgi:membrane protease YdiL (CAAX protease family)
MIDNQEKSAWWVLLLVVFASGAGLLMGTALGAGIASLFYEGDGNFLENMGNQTDDRLRVPLLVVQGMTTLCGFLIAPYFMWTTIRKKDIATFNTSNLKPIALLLVLCIVIAFAVADSAIIEWNEHIHFPDFLSSFEKWARAKEDQLAELTKMLTQFQSFSEFALAFLVVAIFAGICEEFLFRGIIQTELLKGAKNIHAAIWISAFFFSAIHVQFFGFVPRMLLGALFGYLYYWSGNLWVPMFAHFVNNGFAVCMIYLYQKKIVDTNLESPEAAPWPAVIVASAIVVAALWYFKEKIQSSNPSLT